MKLEEDTPIFSKQKLNFNPSDRITHLTVANDYLVLVMANGVLFRIDLTCPDRNEGIFYILIYPAKVTFLSITFHVGSGMNIGSPVLYIGSHTEFYPAS